MKRGAIVLAGGKSTRMGRDKASLPFGDESMLGRVVRLVGEAVEPATIVVVVAAEQTLPPLPQAITIVRDERPERGPLEGIAAGLKTLVARGVEAAFVTPCDVPLLRPTLVARMFELLGDADVVVPYDGAKEYPLSGVYRTTTLAAIDRQLSRDELRVRDLFQAVATRRVPLDELRDVDPELKSLENVNEPSDVDRARSWVNERSEKSF